MGRKPAPKKPLVLATTGKKSAAAKSAAKGVVGKRQTPTKCVKTCAATSALPKQGYSGSTPPSAAELAMLPHASKLEHPTRTASLPPSVAELGVYTSPARTMPVPKNAPVRLRFMPWRFPSSSTGWWIFEADDKIYSKNGVSLVGEQLGEQAQGASKIIN